jgi:phosphomannomutase
MCAVGARPRTYRGRVRADLEARARAWRDDDPDPATRAELGVLLEAGDEAAVAERFGGRLTFGTAGIRGPLGAGPARMNRALARRVAAGLASELLASDAAAARAVGVVVAHDARHGSPVLADDVAAVLAGAGVPAHLLPGPVPTPVLAFGVRHLACAAGVMVTASHNPPTDNGLKVYGADGAQITPPTDARISAATDAAGPAVSLPLGSPRRLGREVLDAYLDAAAATMPSLPGAPPLRLVHTALHGCATAPLQELFRRAGLPPFHPVASQADPDPSFPTVTVPNPEEAGALDLLLCEAERTGAAAALAHDPDADRLAVAVPAARGWRVLTGDELGILLADHVLRSTTGADRLVVSTVVSSHLLGHLADEHGVAHAVSLPGAKWIMRAAAERPTLRFVFGYEEALGYVVGDLVRDKDGLTAALAAARLLAELAAAGETVDDRLETIARRHGHHATTSWSISSAGEGAQRAARALERLAAVPPAAVAGRRIVAAERPAADLTVLRLDRGRVAVRPSGTEEKVKCYVEVVVPRVGPGRSGWAAAQAEADDALARLRRSVGELLGLDDLAPR